MSNSRKPGKRKLDSNSGNRPKMPKSDEWALLPDDVFQEVLNIIVETNAAFPVVDLSENDTIKKTIDEIDDFLKGLDSQAHHSGNPQQSDSNNSLPITKPALTNHEPSYCLSNTLILGGQSQLFFNNKDNLRKTESLHITIKGEPFILIEGNYWHLNTTKLPSAFTRFIGSTLRLNSFISPHASGRMYIPLEEFKKQMKTTSFSKEVVINEAMTKKHEITLTAKVSIGGYKFTYNPEDSKYYCNDHAINIVESLKGRAKTKMQHSPNSLLLIEHCFQLVKGAVSISLEVLMKIAFYFEDLIQLSKENPIITFELSPQANQSPVVTYLSDLVKNKSDFISTEKSNVDQIKNAF